MVVVNSAMIMTYYEIGTIINQRKAWGNKYIERLSNDLKEYGRDIHVIIYIEWLNLQVDFVGTKLWNNLFQKSLGVQL